MPQFDDKRTDDRMAELRKREEENLTRTLAPKYGCQYIDLRGISIDIGALTLVPEDEARKAELAVFLKTRDTVSVTTKNPKNPHAVEILERFKKEGVKVVCYMSTLKSIEHAWERYADLKNATAEKSGVLDIDPTEVELLSKEVSTHLDMGPILMKIQEGQGLERISKTVELIFGGAFSLGASDIHIEPEEKAIRLRYRLDGVLWDIADIDNSLYKHLISRFKLLSGLILNITDEAQDGRFSFEFGGRKLEVRTSIIPGNHGETVVMRILDPDASSFRMDNLGLNPKLLEVIKRELKRPNGAFITTGPTGSGKTTALYAFMQEIHSPEVKIITLEDPIEYKLKGVVQTQVGEDYSFETGLRSILRQDPDVIMVGEIRDRDVAETAVHAALTGHLVFSTLHTNSATGAFPRLMDLGVDPRMLGSAFNLIMAQRLVRKLCEHCKVERETTVEEQKVIARIMDRPVAVSSVYDAPGCAECGGLGFKGRIGIFEGILVDKAVEEAVIKDPRESSILTAAKPQDIPSMQEDGVMKLLAGITSFDELSRVIDLYNFKAIADADVE
ncbi:type II/IV secretion system protein [bacterium]|nr:type II/IV secretion system protein [bacterium]